jgi:hypothetical protein
VKLLQNRIKPAEFIRTVWSAQPEPGTTLEEMLLPEYWSNVAKTLKAGDRIDVTSAEATWFAELFVRSAGDKDAKVHVMRHIVFNAPVDKEADATLDVRHRGGAGWSVVRKSDKAVLFEGGKTREEAESWVKANNLG